jgi:NDP-sugar pyrophosphorylase family protein
MGQLATTRPRHGGLTAIVLVGGRGTRLAVVRTDIPKVLIPVAGKPFLYWVASWLSDHGVVDTIYAAGHLGDQIESWVERLELPAGDRARCRREQSAMGTGGAVLGCLDLCNDLVLIANGDTLVLADLTPIVECLRAEATDGVIVAVPVADTSRFGNVEADEQGMLRAFREKQPGAGLVNSGLFLVRRRELERFLPVHSLSLEADVLPSLLRDGARIRVMAVDAPFLDIGVPDALAAADAFVTAHYGRGTSAQDSSGRLARKL